MKKRPNHNFKRPKDHSSAQNKLNNRVFPQGTVVIGRNSVTEILRHLPKRIIRILVCGGEGDERVALEGILHDARAINIRIDKVTKEDLANLANSESHQSIAAILKDREYEDLSAAISRFKGVTPRLVLGLDAIADPQNLGALLRAAECFSVDGVLFSSNRGASITPVATKASVGASELLNLIKVSNLVEATRKLKDEGFWVVASDCNPKAIVLSEFRFPEKTLLLIGAEGKGLQRLLKDQADFNVWIPMSGRISSLNVSQASAILLERYRSQFILA